jgi:hypothetical protein
LSYNRNKENKVATDRQINFINRLLDERNLLASPKWFAATAFMDEAEYAAHLSKFRADVPRMTVRGASLLIGRLSALPRREEARVEHVAEQVAELKPGVYRLDGTIYVVKPNRSKTRLYAKRLQELRATQDDRLAESGGHVHFDFVYAPGVVHKLKPEMMLPIDEAKELMVRYGRCIACGRTLKVAESVERGIGPVCIKYFA